jgi:hypothetical protein
MRFVVLVAGGVATGALSVGAIQTMAPQHSQMFQTVHALGGRVSDVKLTDVNPLKAYDEVKRQITSGNIGNSLNLSGPSSAVPVTISQRKLANPGAGEKPYGMPTR